MNHRSSLAIMALMAFGISGAAHAQSPENYWINPAGGDWNDPSNWVFNQVPDETDPAYFITPDDYTVISAQTLVQGIYVDAGEIDFISSSSASSPVDFEVLELFEITGDVSAQQAARFRLRGQGNARINSLILGQGLPGWNFAAGGVLHNIPHLVGLVTLWGAAILTVITGWDYLRVGLKHMD